MEQTALRPKPMPGGEPCGDRPSGPTRRPHAAPRRARQRLVTLLLALAACVALVLSGVGLGTMGATVIGMSRLAELRERAAGERGAVGRPDADADDRARGGLPKSAPGQGSSVSPGIGAPTRPTLGVEAVDAPAPVPAAAPSTAATPSTAPTSAGAAGRGALVVGVHIPGPGHAAGLVRGDTVLALGGTRTGSASDLARAVAAARPGVALKLLVRHANGTRQYLVAVPGVVT
ncbi:PDZ domain-containing protein [Streptomyces sp. MNU76]|uniref:PDZ domain-containing protein n=1 Tax=Streptomyces sp. MNU76 TaxID=2560026 RepID=UPI001E2F9547|nr:PDZ domain-containing protein [Streptomyces sp. MNU76]MCC9705216.1 PDZ domain-containing protein [Streptomyces sp. MNU76]